MTVKRDLERGTWYFVVDVRKAGGKRQQIKRRGFATKKAAEQAEAEVITENSRGAFVRPARVTVERFLVDEWLPTLPRQLKPSSVHAYTQIVTSYLVPRLGDVPLGDVDAAMLTALYVELERGDVGRNGARRARSPKTCATSTVWCTRRSGTLCAGVGSRSTRPTSQTHQRPDQSR